MGVFDLFNKRNRVYTEDEKGEMLERQDHRCASCGCRVHIRNSDGDHIWPYSAGGSTDLSNGQILCKRCHKIKTNDQKALYYPDRRNPYGARSKSSGFDDMFGLGSGNSSGGSSSFDDMFGLGSGTSKSRKRGSKKSSGFDDMFGL